MQTSLAIYEALIQAKVPAHAARRVAESLERDMNTTLATKQDLLALRQELHLEMARLEHRLVTKLGLLMTGLFGLAGTVLALLR